MKVYKLGEGDKTQKALEALDKNVIGKVPFVMIVTASWCGHCQMTKPEWESAKKTVAKNAVHLIEVDEVAFRYLTGSMPAHPLSKLLYANVSGFPTIAAVTTTKRIKLFSKPERSSKYLAQFIIENEEKKKPVVKKPPSKKTVTARKSN